MNRNQKTMLSNLIKEYDTEDTTGKIRKLKHSKQIEKDLNYIETYRNDENFKEICDKECTFLQEYYNDIYNRLINNNMDMSVMRKLIMLLKKIENGNMDQHEASYKVGLLLKETYVDKKINSDSASASTPDSASASASASLSWKDYKREKNI